MNKDSKSKKRKDKKKNSRKNDTAIDNNIAADNTKEGHETETSASKKDYPEISTKNSKIEDKTLPDKEFIHDVAEYLVDEIINVAWDQQFNAKTSYTKEKNDEMINNHQMAKVFY